MGLINTKHQNSVKIKIDAIKKNISQLNSANIDLSDKDTVQQIQNISKEIIDVFRLAREESQGKLLIEDFATDTKNWLILINDFISGKNTYLLPSLSECACINSDNFNRFKNTRRENIESEIISFIKERFPNPETANINYLSLGGGGLLQDFIIIAKLLMLGYKNININLIDPEHASYKIKDDDRLSLTRKCYLEVKNGTDGRYKLENIIIEKSESLKQFELLALLSEDFNAKLTINSFASIDEYEGKADLITVIDFDDFHREAFNDTIKTHQALQTDGRMFLSAGDNDYIFDKNKRLGASKQNDVIDTMLEKLQTRNLQTLRIANLTVFNFNNVLYNIIIPYISKHQSINEVVLTLAEPQEVTFFGNPKGAKHPNIHMSKDSLEYYIKLFLPQGVNIKLNYIKGNKNFEKLLPQIDENQDLVLCLGKVNIDGTEAAFNDIDTLHKKFYSADFICAIQSTTKSSAMNKPTLSFACEWIWNYGAESPHIMCSADDLSSARLKKFYQQFNQSYKVEEIKDSVNAFKLQ